MKKYIEFIIRRRFVVLAVVLILSVAFGAIASRGVLSSDIGKLFFGENHPGFKRYKERIREFANDDMIIVVYKDYHLLSAASLSRLERAVDGIESLPEIRRVDSLLNAQHMYGREDALYIENYADEALENPENVAEVLENITSDSMYRGLLVSGDGRHAAVIIELEPEDEMTGESIPPLVKKIMSLFEQAGFDPDNLHRVGFTSSAADVVTQTDYNIRRLFPISCVLLLVVVYVMFHRIWPVFITLGVSLIGVLWTVGVAVLLDRQINIFISIAPVVIMIVATSDIIHLCSAYLLELAKGLTKSEAILLSGTEVGTACFWTSATTFIGFVALTFAPIPMFQQLGLVLGFGVAASLLLAMTLTPILFSLMKQPNPRTYNASRAQRLLSRILSGIEARTFRQPWLVTALFIIMYAVSLHGSFHVNIDTDFYKRFKEESRTRRDEAYCHRHFAGANFLEIFIDLPEAGGALEPDIFARIAAFQRAVKALPEVDDALSYVNLITTIDRELNPEYAPDQTSVWTRKLLAQYLLLFESSGGEDLDRLVGFERKTLRMNARLSENGARFTHGVGKQVQRIAAEIFGSAAVVESTGIMYLLGGFVDDIVNGQRRGLLFAFFTIMAMMTFMFRSFKIGFWSMIPNTLPLLALGGYLGYCWDAVDSDTFIIAMVAVGIGVDDTIHFLSRLRFESAHTSDPDTALKRTFHFSGRAMMTTTLILSAGFLPLGLSDYFSIGIFGTLLPATLIVAVLADILLVPALAKLGVVRFHPIQPTKE